MSVTDLYNHHAQQLESFQRLLLKANKRINLISKSEEQTIYSNILDSLLLTSHISQHSNTIDLGSGGGLPVIPLAITCPETQFTAIDSSLRKCDFLIYAAGQLKLKNLTVTHSRIEDREELHGTFQAVTARALAGLESLLPLSIPFLANHKESSLIFLKGKKYEEELKNANKILLENKLTLKEALVHTDIPGRDLSAVLIFQRSVIL